jgi:hypothetical protein
MDLFFPARPVWLIDLFGLNPLFMVFDIKFSKVQLLCGGLWPA